MTATRTARGRRVLILNLTRLGDLLQTSPTIASLHAGHPDTHVTLVVDKNFAEVCSAIPGVDRVLETDLDALGRHVLNGGIELVEAFESARGLVGELRSHEYDLALNYSSSRMSAIFMGLLRIPEVRGWSATPEGHRLISHPWSRLFATSCLNRQLSDVNLVDHYRLVAGGGPAPRRLLFETNDRGRERARSLLGGADAPVVALQLGASRASRVWPPESFAAVARDLRAHGFRIALLGGAKERALAESVNAAMGGEALDLCGRTDLTTLAAVLERASLLVTGDTGPMHLAAAMGTPIVGLFFGPALPFDTGPYGTDHVLLHAAVPCAPCAHSVSCLDPYCRTEIPPDRVAAIARARIAEDWAEVQRIASGPGALAVYRTGFDAHGLYQCERVGAGPTTPRDALRRAYRAVWLAALEGHPLPTERTAGVDTRPFVAVSETARRGVETARELERSVVAGRDGRLEVLGGALAGIDQQLERLGAVEPDVRPLTQMYKFEQESLPPGSVASLARAQGGLYRVLEFEARAMTELLTEPQATGYAHAS